MVNSKCDLKRHPMVYPLALTTLRLLLAPLVLVWAVNGRTGLPYIFSLVIALLSDYFDGVMARRYGVDTAALRRYDSAADVIFYGAALSAVWLIYPNVVRANRVAIGLL